MNNLQQDPHGDTPVATGCGSLADSTIAMVLLHGRGGSAQDMLSLSDVIGCRWCTCIAPQAAGHSWYPLSFLELLERNEPWLSSALFRLDALFTQLDEDGFPSSKVVLLGFSQGACLAMEYAARHPCRFGTLVGLSGGLIGPPGTTWQISGSLDGTPVFLGCSEHDPHIPRERVDETARVLAALGGQVTQRIYPQMGHTVNQDEIDHVRKMLQQIKS